MTVLDDTTNNSQFNATSSNLRRKMLLTRTSVFSRNATLPLDHSTAGAENNTTDIMHIDEENFKHCQTLKKRDRVLSNNAMTESEMNDHPDTETKQYPEDI